MMIVFWVLVIGFIVAVLVLIGFIQWGKHILAQAAVRNND